MLFWIIAAALSLIVTLGTLWPLFRRRPGAVAARAQHDVEVYGAQLRELEKDAERGAIGAPEAAVAKAEIARRLLRSADRAAAAAPSGSAGGRAVLAAGVVLSLALPGASLLLYARFGSPDVPDRPLAARAGEGAGGTGIMTVIAEVERRMREDPSDARGWDVLAPVYLRLGEADKAADAFRKAIASLGPSAAREAGLGEALTQGAEGEVTAEAEAAFRRALASEPGHLTARFFLALDLSQEGRSAEAAPAWRDLIAASPADAPWAAIAQAALEDAEIKLAAGAAMPAAPPGPGAAEIAAAAELPDAERAAMIEGMVSGLAARLETAPNDVEGWKRLIRSYSVLGEGEEARLALARATRIFAEGSAERLEIASLAEELGLMPAGESR